MDGYEKPNQGDVKSRKTLTIKTFAEHKNHKLQM
jgi:hypothetical protein